MKRTTCKRRIAFIAAAAILSLTFGASAALAGGGVDWTVTVRNPTPWKANVMVSLASATLSDFVEIQPGGAAVVHCGANCPRGLYGFFVATRDYPRVRNFQETDMQGTWMDAASGGAACWNHRMRICSMPGKEGQLGEKFYTFCKD